MHKTLMEDLYRVNPTVLPCSNDDVHVGVIRVENYFPEFQSSSSAGANLVLQFDHGGGAGCDFHHAEINGSDMFDLIKTQIANHPRYPHLVSAYIDCQKVGAPPEMVSLLEEIGREKNPFINSCSSEMGDDPELDQFMESYCEVLHRYKEELSKPFDEATAFLATIGSQLSNLCQGSMTNHSNIFDYASDELVGTSEEELSCGEIEATESTQESPGCLARGQDLKGMLLRKYSGYISNLKKDFLKKRKKSKLPKDARIILMEWWSNHSRWPYPTEEEKAKLSERTGLDQKQMNNWFINQRKRHWKPSEEMRFALVDGVSTSAGGGGGGPDTYFDNIGGDHV